jgi:hypothetical protein
MFITAAPYAVHVCLHAAGPDELQLLLEVAEVYEQTIQLPFGAMQWTTMTTALGACPYPALVEFNTRHGRTLITLAERSLEAALAAAAPPGNANSRAVAAAAKARAQHMEETGQLFSCLCRCLDGGQRGKMSASSSNSYEARGGFLLCVT